MKRPAPLKIIAASFAALCATFLATRRGAAPVPTLRDALNEETSVSDVLEKAKNNDQALKPVEGKPITSSMDLHTHSYCSDGDMSPEALVQEAKDAGLTYYALTDHDTTACLARAQAKAEELRVKLIPGIEVSAEDDSLHILALGIDPQAPEIVALGAKADEDRLRRMRAIVEKLPQDKPAGAASIDLVADVLLPKLNRERLIDGKKPLSRDQASKMTTDHVVSQIRGQITRPDIAKTLVAKKWAVNNQDAFNRFLNPGRAAYVPMNGPSFRQAIQAIHAAGGIAVWAHPYTIYKFKKTPWVFSGKNYYDFETLAEDMMQAGLDGFQLYTPGWERFMDVKVSSFAEAYRKKSGKQLVLTPGSDYHGGHDIGPKAMGGMSAPEKEIHNILGQLHLN
jgi:predicted metal-dependent phosphoesterase TrpH